MSRRRCCCDCPLFGDEFTRADSDDPGTDWDEVSGDWDIASNQLTETGTADTLCIFQPNVDDERMVVGYTTKSESAGNVYRIIGNYLDSSHYLYAELSIGNWTTGASLAIYQVDGGTPLELASQSITLTDTTRTLSLCIGSDTISTTVSGAGADLCVWMLQVEGDKLHTGGYLSGVGNGAAQQIYVDGFSITAHWEANRNCPQCCPCRCQGIVVPPQLCAEYQGEGDCNTLDGISVALDQTDSHRLQWSGAISGGCLDGLRLILHCPEDEEDVTTWLLEFDPTGVTDPSGLWCAVAPEMYADVSSLCDPLTLVFKFGPVAHNVTRRCPDTEDCGDCGRAGPAMPPPEYITEYTITVTECPA